MKKFTALAIAFSFVGLAFNTPENKSDYNLDNKASKIEWTGKKISGQHYGTVAIKEGTIKVKDGNITGGEVTIDMNSIENLDLSGEYKQKLEGHLKSPDFFNTEEYPEATFKIKKVVKIKDENEKGATHMVTGDLTIKGITNEIEVPSYIQFKDDKLVSYADFSIDRTKWKVKYGSGEFYDDLGDKMIYDDINFKLKIAATK